MAGSDRAFFMYHPLKRANTVRGKRGVFHLTRPRKSHLAPASTSHPSNRGSSVQSRGRQSLETIIQENVRNFRKKGYQLQTGYQFGAHLRNALEYSRVEQAKVFLDSLNSQLELVDMLFVPVLKRGLYYVEGAITAGEYPLSSKFKKKLIQEVNQGSDKLRVKGPRRFHYLGIGLSRGASQPDWKYQVLRTVVGGEENAEAVKQYMLLYNRDLKVWLPGASTPKCPKAHMVRLGGDKAGNFVVAGGYTKVTLPTLIRGASEQEQSIISVKDEISKRKLGIGYRELTNYQKTVQKWAASNRVPEKEADNLKNHFQQLKGQVDRYFPD